MCIHFSHKCNANLILLASRFHYINETNNILVLSKYKKHFILKKRQPKKKCLVRAPLAVSFFYACLF